MLELLDVDAGEAVMVGDTLEDDIEGARAVGMRAVLVDRDGRFPDARPTARRPARGLPRRARPRLSSCVVGWLIWVDRSPSRWRSASC